MEDADYGWLWVARRAQEISPNEIMRSPEARTNTLWTRENDSNIHKIGSLQTKVRVDNGSKVNVMDKNLQLASNFPMIMDPKL